MESGFRVQGSGFRMDLPATSLGRGGLELFLVSCLGTHKGLITATYEASRS